MGELGPRGKAQKPNLMARKNVTVERFKRLIDTLQKEVADGAAAELNSQADNLVERIREAAPKKIGVLAASVRKVPTDDPNRIKIVAGGPGTTVSARSGNGKYDYSLGVEFGTQEAPANPFFYSTYRVRKKPMRSAMKRRISAAIKKRSAAP